MSENSWIKAMEMVNGTRNRDSAPAAEARQKPVADNENSWAKAMTMVYGSGKTSSTPFTIPTAYGPQKSTVERVGTHLADVKNGGAKKRYDTYQSNLRRIGEIDGILNSPYMQLKTSTGDRQEYNDLSAEKKKLEATNRVYERSNLHWDKTYVENAGAENYAELSQKRNFGNPTQEQIREFGTKAYGGYITNADGYGMKPVEGLFPETVPVEQAMAQMGVNLAINDPLGYYRSTIGGTLPEGTSELYSPRYTMAETEAAGILKQGDRDQWSNLTDEEVSMYYYLMNTKGKDAAMEFLSGMARELQYRETEEYKEYMRTASAGDKVLSNVASTVVKPVGDAVAFADEAISHIKGEEPNYHNAAHGLKNFADTTRGMTASAIDKATGASDSDFVTWGDAYQGVMSGADSAVGALLLGKGYTVVAGMGAASSEAKRLYEAGASKEEVIAGSLMAGAAEAFFEHFSIGYLVDDVLKKPTRNIAKKFLQVLGMAGVEASEEFATTFANYITDAAARGDTSDLQTMIEEYEKDGYTRGAAVFEAIKQVGGEALHSAVIGLISGTGMGTVGVINNSDSTGESGETLNSEELDTWAESEGISFGGTMLNGSGKDVPVVDLSDDSELAKRIEGLKGSPKYKVIQEYILDVIGNEPFRLSDGKIAVVDKRDAKHLAAGTIEHRQIATIAKIKELVESAVLCAEAPEAVHNKFKHFWYYQALIQYDGDTFPIYLNIGETINDNTYHLYAITEKLKDTADPQRGLVRPKPNEGYVLKNGAFDTTVTQKTAGVNTHSMQDGENYSRTATTPMGDVQVVERALQLTAEGKRKATAADFDGILQELGEEETLKRLYNSQQFDRPTGMVEIEGRQVDANAYVDAYEQTLPNDPVALQEVVRNLEKQHADEILQMEQEGTLKNYKPHRLKIDLQLFAAKRKIELLQLEPGEDGSKVRQFWEKRLNGNDEMHSEELLELMAGRTETYDPISNQETLNKARDKFMEDGYRSRLLKQLGKRSSARRLTEVDVAAAIELTRKAYNDGDYEVMMDLIAGLSRRGTELGRAVQAFSMMARMTPEGVLKAAHRTVKADADYVIGEGASEGLDVLADDIAGALDKLARLKGLGNDTSSTASGPPSPQGEGRAVEDARPYGEGAVEDADVQVAEKEGSGQRVTVQVSRENVVGALAKDLAATEGTYLTREDIEKNLEKVIKDATDVPEQVKRYVLKKLRKKDGGLAQRLYELHQKGHLTADATRRAMEEALELPTLTNEDVQTLVNMTTRVQELADDPIKQADAMEEIYDFLGAKMAVDWVDRLQAWRKFAMLTNPKTHIRNEVSNVAYMPMRKADSMFATVLERIFLRDPEKRAAQFGWKCTKHGQSILPTIQKKVPEAVLEFKQQGPKYETGTGQLKQHRKMFGKSKFGEFLNKTSRGNSDFMDKRDEVYFKRAYVDALGQIMTARNATEVTQKMHDTAMVRAREAVFRAETVLGDVFKFLKQWQGSSNSVKRAVGQLTDVVVPFTNTPANIMTQSALHSPLGLAAGTYQLAQKVWGKNGKESAEIINTFAKGITGTLLYGIAVLLGRAGLIHTGFGKTEKERAADEMAGIQENSFDICGVNVSFDWLQPVAAPIVAGAVLGEALRDEDPTFWAILDGTLESADSLFELSMLQSLYDFFGGYEAGVSGSLVSVGENAISQSIPTLLGQTARAIDPVQRKTQGDNAFETALNQVLAKIPGLTYLLDPELDVWGNEVHRTGKPSGGGTALNAAQQFALPWNTKTGTGAGDYVSEEILRLYEEYGSQVIPTAISRDDAHDKGLDYVEDNRILGAVNRTAVEDFINDVWPYQVQETLPNGKKRTVTKFYSEMTDDERRRVLSRIYQKSKETVTGETEDTKTKSKQDRYFEQLFEEMR
ncbi:MAG: hypothetical protein IJO42_00780 [Clostridia bacterium]|nr:hypothetical protein [Clostridia bacterium]